MFIKKKVIVKLFKPKDSNKCVYQKKRLLSNFLNLKILRNGFIKKKMVLVKRFKHENSIQICLLKKKVIVKLFKPKSSNEISLPRKKGIVKYFKRKDSNEISFLKKKVSVELFKRQDSNEIY